MSSTTATSPSPSPKPPAKVEIPLEGEAKKVYDWRLHVLTQAGYGEFASELAVLDHFKVDLHIAAELLENDCPLETALQILR